MRYGYMLCAPLLLVLLGGCLPEARLISTVDPSLSDHPYNRVVIRVDTADPGWRQGVETMVAWSTGTRGLAMVAETMALAPGGSMTEDQRRAALIAEGVDAMLVLRPIRGGIDSAYVPPRTVSTTTSDVRSSSSGVKKSSSESRTREEATSTTRGDTTADTSRTRSGSASRTSTDAVQTRSSGAAESMVTRSESYTTVGYMSRTPWVDLTMNVIDLRTGRIVWMSSYRLNDDIDGRRYLSDLLAVTLDHDGVVRKR